MTNRVNYVYEMHKKPFNIFLKNIKKYEFLQSLNLLFSLIRDINIGENVYIMLLKWFILVGI